MASKIAVSDANAMLEVLGARLNGGVIRVYSGARVANVGVAPTGANVNLADVGIGAAAFGAAANAVLTATPGDIGDDTAINASGNASWFRVFKGATAVLDGDVGIAGSGAELIVNRVNLVQDGTFDITAFVVDFSAAV